MPRSKTGSRSGDRAMHAAIRRLTDSHAALCRCVSALSIDRLELAPAILRAVTAAIPTGRKPVLLALPYVVPALTATEAEDLITAVHRLASLTCPTKSKEVDPPFVPWRERPRIGVHAKDDRWPDEWDAQEWAQWLTSTPSDSRQLSGPVAYEYAAARLAGRSWEWNEPPDGEILLDLDRWGRDDALKALHLVRSRLGYPWAVCTADIGAIAVAAKQAYDAAWRFVRYVDGCDRGLAVPPPAHWAALNELNQ